MTVSYDITLLIPAWNAASTLPRALASVEAQTVRPAHILIVDDGSQPPLDLPASGTIPVQLHRLETNSGSSAALNAGLALITTEWTALLDADDEWLPEKLARQLPLMDSADLIATGLRFVAPDGRARLDVAIQPLPSAPLASLLEDCVIGKPTVLARTAVLLADGGFDTQLPMGEDQDKWLRIAAHHRVALVPEVLVLAHDMPGSLSRRTRTAPDFLWKHVIEPIFRHHMARFNATEKRRIVGARCQQAAAACIARDHYRLALRYLLRASLAGWQPLANLWSAITGAPPVKWFKARLQATGRATHRSL
jgi:glycosyltransferase involved in cell wall biosynthesis